MIHQYHNKWVYFWFVWWHQKKSNYFSNEKTKRLGFTLGKKKPVKKSYLCGQIIFVSNSYNVHLHPTRHLSPSKFPTICFTQSSVRSGTVARLLKTRNIVSISTLVNCDKLSNKMVDNKPHSGYLTAPTYRTFSIFVKGNACDWFFFTT